jgi:murein DD-endopeptidase MepM/ murein hydrolase activator NlpD
VHWGIDIAAPAGMPVLASAAGVVQYAGWYAGYGLVVVLAHKGGWQTVYGHLGQINVHLGRPVEQAAVIGRVGSTGISTGPHLHFEVRYRGRPVDPLSVLR